MQPDDEEELRRGINTVAAGTRYCQRSMGRLQCSLRRSAVRRTDLHRPLLMATISMTLCVEGRSHGLQKPDAAIRQGAIHLEPNEIITITGMQAGYGSRSILMAIAIRHNGRGPALSDLRQAAAGQSGC